MHFIVEEKPIPLTLMSYEKAKAVILSNANDEDGWTYVLEKRGEYYAIAIYDDEKYLVGYF